MIPRYGQPTAPPQAPSHDARPAAAQTKKTTALVQTAPEPRLERVSIAALALATKSTTPLQVPPHNVMRLGQSGSDQYAKNLLRGTRVEEHLLRDENGQYYILGDVIFSDTGGAVRGMRKPDRDVSQVYVVKEIAFAQAYDPFATTPAHGTRTERLPNQSERDTAREVNIQAAIRHALTPHFQIHTGDRVFLAMPQMASDAHVVLSQLSQRTQTQDVTQTMPLRAAMAHTMLSGVIGDLAALHSKGFVHRDIKPENMLLRQDGDLYLADFGHAAEDIAGRRLGADELFGTVGYRAPEVRVGAVFDGRKADVWSLGVSAIQALYGKNPFSYAYHAQRAPSQDGAPTRKDDEAVRAHSAFLKAWAHGVQLTQAWLAAGAKGAAPTVGDPDVDALLSHLHAHAQGLLPIVLPMLEVAPSRRATAHQVAAKVAQLPLSAVPPRQDLLRELRSQAFPVVDAIRNDPRLSRVQPGERALRPGGVRRANSTETLLRPFVSPFGVDAPSDPTQDHHPSAWLASPRFEEVSAFLNEQATRLWTGWTLIPNVMDRIDQAGDQMAQEAAADEAKGR